MAMLLHSSQLGRRNRRLQNAATLSQKVHQVWCAETEGGKVRFMNRDSKARALLVLIGLFFPGCTQPVKEVAVVEHRAGLARNWNHDIGAAVPHRMSILNDGTEILTVGQHDHGQFLLLMRYRDEQRFVIVNQNGVLSAEAEGK